MDAFEDLVARLLRNEGYWTSPGYRIDLAKADKVEIGLPSMPRPEVDVLAYRPVANVLLWVECKSFLDSPGVRSRSFDPSRKEARQYRVFTNARFREVASRVLVEQAVSDEIARVGVDVRYCLIAGHFYRDSQAELQPLFEQEGWLLRGPEWVTAELRKLAARSYENDIVTLAVKLLERHPPTDT